MYALMRVRLRNCNKLHCAFIRRHRKQLAASTTTTVPHTTHKSCKLMAVVDAFFLFFYFCSSLTSFILKQKLPITCHLCLFVALCCAIWRKSWRLATQNKTQQQQWQVISFVVHFWRNISCDKRNSCKNM